MEQFNTPEMTREMSVATSVRRAELAPRTAKKTPYGRA
jgi:hypothetical protein